MITLLVLDSIHQKFLKLDLTLHKNHKTAKACSALVVRKVYSWFFLELCTELQYVET